MSGASHDSLAADIFEWLASMPFVPLPVKVLAHGIVAAIRERGATVESLVAAMHKVEPLKLPWDESPGGKAP